MGQRSVAAQRSVRLRDDLADISVYAAPWIDAPVRLNTNETSWGVPDEVRAELARAVERLDLHRYPDPEAHALRAALARYSGHEIAGVWAANGSNEVLQQLLMAFGGAGRTCLVVEPTYAMHARIARATGTTLRREVWPRAERPLTASDAAELVASVGAQVTMWCSPNNPTGEAASPDVLEAVCEAAPGLVIIDAAYAEFGEGAGAALVNRYEHVVVVRTLSKALRAAGVRLGYVLAQPWVVDALHVVRLPYHLSALTQVAGVTLLGHADQLTRHVALTQQERERVRTTLERLPGLRVLPSDANFLCFRTGLAPREVFDQLLARGVLIRDISSYPTLEDWSRVTIGTPDENDQFLSALTEVVHAATSQGGAR